MAPRAAHGLARAHRAGGRGPRAGAEGVRRSRSARPWRASLRGKSRLKVAGAPADNTWATPYAHRSPPVQPRPPRRRRRRLRGAGRRVRRRRPDHRQVRLGRRRTGPRRRARRRRRRQRRGARRSEQTRARHAGARARASPRRSPTSSARATSPTPSPTTRAARSTLPRRGAGSTPTAPRSTTSRSRTCGRCTTPGRPSSAAPDRGRRHRRLRPPGTSRPAAPRRRSPSSTRASTGPHPDLFEQSSPPATTSRRRQRPDRLRRPRHARRGHHRRARQQRHRRHRRRVADELIPVEALDASGEGTRSRHRRRLPATPRPGRRIVNASFGGVELLAGGVQRDPGRPERPLRRRRRQRDGANDDTTPSAIRARYDLPNILCVAATDNNDQLATLLQLRPDSVDIAAPGVGIYSTYRVRRATPG